MIDLIKRKQPAVMLCHWPGMYNNGALTGFRAFQRIVTTLKASFGDQTIWMKLSEIGRYYAAKQLTEITANGNGIQFDAPFAADAFTIQFKKRLIAGATLHFGNQQTPMKSVASLSNIKASTMHVNGDTITCCFDLERGKSQLTFN